MKKHNRHLLDFHTHSNYSDGSDSPIEIVKEAKKRGVYALALTDHNVLSGLDEFQFAVKKYDLFAIPFGIEIHAELPKKLTNSQYNQTLDLILLGKNPKKEEIKGYHNLILKDLIQRRIPETLLQLSKFGFEIPKFNIKEQIHLKNAVPKIFHDFLDYKNNINILVKYVTDKNPLTDKKMIKMQPRIFLNRYIYAIDSPNYVSKLKGFGVKDAIELSKEMNCELFIAHPGGEYGCLSDKLLNYLIKSGIKGIEIRNYFNTKEQNKKFDQLAKEHSLIRSGGSDYHGKNSIPKIGMYDRPNQHLQTEILEELWDNLPS